MRTIRMNKNKISIIISTKIEITILTAIIVIIIVHLGLVVPIRVCPHKPQEF